VRKITTLNTGRGQAKKVNIFLDGELAFSLEADAAAKERLQVDQVQSPEETESTRSGDFQRCMKAAVRYLSYRPRGEAELRERLTQRGFARDIQDAVINKLSGQGLVNDSAFAQFWADNREAFRPRSQWLTRLELSRKGVANEVIDQVVNTIDDEANAYRAAQSKARQLSGADYPTFRRKLGGYLQRRGFSSSVIKGTLERIRQDQKRPNNLVSQPGLQ
jgi:regulatory protein